VSNTNSSVYLLTRTHNRPENFQRCLESVSQQTVLPRWIIISDDPVDTYIDAATIPHQVYRPTPRKPCWWIRHHNPFNAYFNEALALIPDGHFIIYLDDDDILLDNTWVETILQKDCDVLIGKFQLGSAHQNRVIGEKLERGKIGGSCVAVRSEIARRHPWPRRGGGDFMFLQSLAKRYTFTWHAEIVAGVQENLGHSWGRRKSY